MTGKIRKHISDNEIKLAVENTNSHKEARELLMQEKNIDILASSFHYWCKNIKFDNIHTGDSKAPKVLIFDIESSPLKVYAWGLWNQNHPIGAIIQDWELLCWSAKWLGSKEIFNSSQYKHKWNEELVVTDLWQKLDEADYVVAHNAVKFDVKKMNAKFLQYDLKLPSYYKVIDTLQIAKSNFNMTSNKLDWLASFVGEENKNSTNFQLWIDCDNKVVKAWKEMISYCDQDVNVLEQVYIKLMPWDKRTPQYFTSFDETKPICKVCGGVVKVASKHNTAASSFDVYSCDDCGHNQRSRTSTKDKEEVRMVSC